MPAGRGERVNESTGRRRVSTRLVARLRDYYAASDAELADALGRPLPVAEPDADRIR